MERPPSTPPPPASSSPLVRRRDGVVGLGVSLVVAVALHLALLPALPALVRVTGSRAHKKNGAQLVRLAHADWEKNKRVEITVKEAKPADDPDKKKDDEKKKDDDDDKAPGQVVAMPPPDKEVRPDWATHASEWNQKVEHETASRDARADAPSIARKLEQGKMGVRPTEPAQVPPDGPRSMPTSPADESAGPEGRGRSTSGNSGTDAHDGGRDERMFALEIPKQAAREPLKLKMDVDGILQNRTARPEVPGNGDVARVAIGNKPADLAHRQGGGGDDVVSGQGMQGGGNGTPGLPSLSELTPSPQQIAKLAGAPSNDFLPDVEVDAETRLNAWRWKHATFFNRIHEKVSREWHAGDVLSHNDPTGAVYGFEDRVTVLSVTIDKQGNVLDVNVSEASGAMVLDDEAVRAFKHAGPFNNPPPQLFKSGDRFTFLFGFNVTYNRSNFDLNWKPN